MDRADFIAWYDGLPPAERVKALLVVMHEFTIIMRVVWQSFPDDCATRWRLALHLSEINHALTAAAWQTMDKRPTYSGESLIDIILDQPHYPELEAHCRYALDQAVHFVPGRSR